MSDGIDHRVLHRRGGADRRRFADALRAQRIERSRRLGRVHLERRQLGRRRDRVLGEVRRDRVAILVVAHLFEQRLRGASYEEIARGQILGDSSGFFKMIFHRETRRLLGVHCIGTQATELVHIGQAVLTLGGGLDYFLETVFNYPTLAECYKVAAYSASNHMRNG